MGENSKIEWTDHTFNPWWGCTKISPACDHCYAEGFAKRTGQPGLWKGERKRTSENNWKQVRKWNRRAQYSSDPRKPRIFCASMADVFDNQVPTEWRTDLWKLIWECDSLEWLLLTKRPQNIAKMLPSYFRDDHLGWRHVRFGITTENQEEYERRMREVPPSCGRGMFISYEPALGPLNLRALPVLPAWVICGGESGPGARQMDPAWAQRVRDDCKELGVAFFMKQMTKKAPIPDDLLVREFPEQL